MRAPLLQSRGTSGSWFKINCDGVVSNIEGRAAIGWVICDHKLGVGLHSGHWQLFHSSVRVMGNTCLKPWIPQGGFRNDNLEAVGILFGGSRALSGHGLVASIQLVLSRDWLVVIQHVGRATNKVR
ncbi:hypothetical protein V6N13_102488 [Hibiscus sabdariffa]|uniref:RNase H type-1 domain-containing protein n=2 Tax=Hibiscus sabdariffa TaxID=183260 RepID=A0ABR1ZKJ2_9ROSI